MCRRKHRAFAGTSKTDHTGEAAITEDMRDYWRPDEGFLKRRNKVQLQALMNDSGASLKLASAAEYKKSELVIALTNHFAKAWKAKKPSDADKKANDWLPEAMAFPAIDPDVNHTQELDDIVDEDDISDIY